jgi:hypothetical protein
MHSNCRLIAIIKCEIEHRQNLNNDLKMLEDLFQNSENLVAQPVT